MFGKVIGCVAGLVALAAGVAALAGASRSETNAGRPHPFSSCGELLAYAKAHADAIAGSGGLGVPSGVVPAPAAADFSATNVQEAGVDEPDIVKSDGSRIFAIAGSKLYAVDARAGKPRLL